MVFATLVSPLISHVAMATSLSSRPHTEPAGILEVALPCHMDVRNKGWHLEVAPICKQVLPTFGVLGRYVVTVSIKMRYRRNTENVA